MKPNDFLLKAVAAARTAGHIYPGYAAAEAALESAWGESKLCKTANNLFGQKQGFTTKGFATVNIPTKEFLKGEWVTVNATWVAFPSWEDSFRCRMVLLQSLSAYKPALEATTGEGFVRAVSKVWATDPDRADKVLRTYRAHRDVLEG